MPVGLAAVDARAARVARSRAPGTRRAAPRAASGCSMPSSTLGVVRHRRGSGTSSSRACASGRRRSGRPPRSARGAASGSVPSLRSSTTDSLGELAGERRGAGGVEVDGAAKRLGVVEVGPASAGGTGDQSASSRPSSAFCRSTRRRARSTSASSTAPGSTASAQRLAERLHRRQLDVDAGGRARAAAASPQVAGDAVQQLAGTRRRSSRRRRCRRSPTSRAAAR